MIKSITNYKGHYCAELQNGKYILNEGSMYLLLCEKYKEGLKVLKNGIISGKMMRTKDDFRWCVEHLGKNQLS